MKLALVIVAAWTTTIPTSLDAQAPVRADTAGLAAQAARLRARDPFRLDRKPATVRYNPWEPVSASAPPPPAPAPPPLALAGLVGGPPWNALIEGIPGVETGLLLQLGDSAKGVRFTALRGDTVIIAGFDTTWSLTAKRPWR